MQQSKNTYMLFPCQQNNHNFYLLLVFSWRQKTERKLLQTLTLHLRLFQQCNPQTRVWTPYMFLFRLDEGIIMKCFLKWPPLFSPSSKNSLPTDHAHQRFPSRSLPLRVLRGCLSWPTCGTHHYLPGMVSGTGNWILPPLPKLIITYTIIIALPYHTLILGTTA